MQVTILAVFAAAAGLVAASPLEARAADGVCLLPFCFFSGVITLPGGSSVEGVLGDFKCDSCPGTDCLAISSGSATLVVPDLGTLSGEISVSALQSLSCLPVPV